MPLGPFDPIPPREKIRRSHINDLRVALTGIQDAYDVAVANGFVGTVGQWLDSLKGEKGDPGAGVPDGGATGQVLAKTGEDDQATGWTDPPDPGVVIDERVAHGALLGGADHAAPVLILSPDGSADADGAISPTNVGGITTAAGQYGAAWQFTASGQSILVPNDGYISRQAGTLLVRVYFDGSLANPQSQEIVRGDGTGVFRVRLQRGYTTALNNYAGFAAGAVYTSVNSPANAAPDDTWLTLAITWQNGQHWGYVDGVLVASGTHDMGSADTAALRVGISTGSGLPYLVESLLAYGERLPDAAIAEVSALAEAHTIATTANTGNLLLPAMRTTLAPPGGAGASTLVLQSDNSTAHAIAIDDDGVMTVGGKAVAFAGTPETPPLTVTINSASSDRVQVSTTMPSGTLRLAMHPSGSGNGAFTFTRDFWSGALFHNTGDDITPIRTNSDTVGANHGWTSVNSYTVTGHDKTTADLGSQWTDGTRTYTLLQISGDVLVFGRPYTVTDGVAYGGDSGASPAATLTHESGATHTTSVPISSSGGVTQLRPCVHSVAVTMELDGMVISDDGTYAGTELVVRESYVIMAYDGIIDWAQANIGTSFEGQTAVPGLMRVTNTYRFGDQGRCLVTTTYVALAKQALGNCGGIQSVQLSRSGYTTYRHMPGVASKSGYDFGGLVDMSSYGSNLLFGPADYDDPDHPPSWYVDWLDNGSKWIGFAAGYLPDVGDSRDARRATLATGWDMRSTNKSYPIALGGETLLPGDIRTIHAFRCYLDPADMGDATVLAQIKGATGTYLVASYLAQAVGVAVPPLASAEGAPVTLLKGDGLQAADTVTASGVVLSAPGSAGHATLKVAP